MNHDKRSLEELLAARAEGTLDGKECERLDAQIEGQPGLRALRDVHEVIEAGLRARRDEVPAAGPIVAASLAALRRGARAPRPLAAIPRRRGVHALRDAVFGMPGVVVSLAVTAAGLIAPRLGGVQGWFTSTVSRDGTPGWEARLSGWTRGVESATSSLLGATMTSAVVAYAGATVIVLLATTWMTMRALRD